MKKLFIFSLLLVLLCVPIFSSCNKNPTCGYCSSGPSGWLRGERHVILSIDQRTYDLSKEKVDITLKIHVHDRYPSSLESDILKEYGTQQGDVFAFVTGFDKPQAAYGGGAYPIMGLGASIEQLIEMSFRDNYEHKVKTENGTYFKWYTRTAKIPRGYFLEGKNYFYIISYQKNWYDKIGFKTFCYVREGDKLQIMEIPEEEQWVEIPNLFNEEVFWESYFMTPDWVIPD